MHPAFASVFLGECPVVCGLRLLPLQLGHAALLDAVASPYMTGEIATEVDLLAAAWVCSVPAVLAFGGRKFWNARPRMVRPFVEEDHALRAYIAHHMQAPRRFPSPNAKPARVPWQWMVAHRLCGGDWSRINAAWNTPLLVATARVFTEDAAAGDDSIRTEADELNIAAAVKELRNG